MRQGQILLRSFAWRGYRVQELEMLTDGVWSCREGLRFVTSSGDFVATLMRHQAPSGSWRWCLMCRIEGLNQEDHLDGARPLQLLHAMRHRIMPTMRAEREQLRAKLLQAAKVKALQAAKREMRPAKHERILTRPRPERHQGVRWVLSVVVVAVMVLAVIMVLAKLSAMVHAYGR
jgi:hypothetical protein